MNGLWLNPQVVMSAAAGRCLAVIRKLLAVSRRRLLFSAVATIATVSLALVFLALRPDVGVAALQVKAERWEAVGPLEEARSAAAAARLADGRILITGGHNGSGPVASAEVFDASGISAAVAPMLHPRSGHTAVTLSDGRVLVAGGWTLGGAATADAEIYDPRSNRWTETAGMTALRAGHTATRLEDGRVLIAGGTPGRGAHATLEVFDSQTGKFQPLAATLLSARVHHAAAVLGEGQVMLAGGSDGAASLSTSEIVDLDAGTVRLGPSLTETRSEFTLTPLHNGKFLAAGGVNGSGVLASAEVYDPEAGRFLGAGRMAVPRRGHLAILLPDNNSVLLAGGTPTSEAAELYLPWREAFKLTGSMPEARSGAVGGPLAAEGWAIVAGGRNGSRPLASSDV